MRRAVSRGDDEKRGVILVKSDCNFLGCVVVTTRCCVPGVEGAVYIITPRD